MREGSLSPTGQMFCVTCHLSHVTFHMSRVIFIYFFYIFFTTNLSYLVEGLLSTVQTQSSLLGKRNTIRRWELTCFFFFFVKYYSRSILIKTFQTQRIGDHNFTCRIIKKKIQTFGYCCGRGWFKRSIWQSHRHRKSSKKSSHYLSVFLLTWHTQLLFLF